LAEATHWSNESFTPQPLPLASHVVVWPFEFVRVALYVAQLAASVNTQTTTENLLGIPEP
jgi:hypothetical protein